MPDMINQPPHYLACRPQVEPIDLTETLGFNLGNAIKYISRAGKKDGSSYEQDIGKAIYYLNREIDSLEREGVEEFVCDSVSFRGFSYFFWMLEEHSYLRGSFMVEYDTYRLILLLKWSQAALHGLIRDLEQKLNGAPQEGKDD